MLRKPAHLQLLRVHISAQRAQHPVALPLGVVALRPELLQGVRLVSVCCQVVTVGLLLLPFPAGAAASACILLPASGRTASAPAVHCSSDQSHVRDAMRQCLSVDVLPHAAGADAPAHTASIRHHQRVCLHCTARLFSIIAAYQAAHALLLCNQKDMNWHCLTALQEGALL